MDEQTAGGASVFGITTAHRALLLFRRRKGLKRAWRWEGAHSPGPIPMPPTLETAMRLQGRAARKGTICSPGYLQERSWERMVPSRVSAQQTAKRLTRSTSMPTQPRQELPR